MSLRTYSLFYYGHTVTQLNRSVDFDEGGAELKANLNVGSYTPTDYAAELKRALNAAGNLNYLVTFDRATRLITISADGFFTLRVQTGTRKGSTAFTMAGFTGADRTGALTYTGNAVSGELYEPQFFLQDYLAPEDNSESVDEKVNESASGVIEVVSFGERHSAEFNIVLATDKNPTGHRWLKPQANALNNLRAFMRYLKTKAPVEFMPNIADRSVFHKLQLEATKANKSGTGFKLKERIREKTPEYFDTETMTFRVVD